MTYYDHRKNGRFSSRDLIQNGNPWYNGHINNGASAASKFFDLAAAEPQTKTKQLDVEQLAKSLADQVISRLKQLQAGGYQLRLGGKPFKLVDNKGGFSG